MSERPLLSFVIPVRNDAARLGRCLSSIAANVSAPPYEIIVVDNGSVDGSAEVAKKAGATVVAVPGSKVSALRNLGADRAQAPLLAFVDADHLLDAGWLNRAGEILSDAQLAGAGAPCSSPDDANWVQRAYGLLRPIVSGQVPTMWLGSGNLVLRKSAFTAVRGFDTSLESCEDVDLCNRLSLAGYQLVADERLRNVHLGDPRTLRGLFFGELWRGRDNLRVTLRGPLTPASLPSIVIPVVDLFCLLVLCASPLLGIRIGLGAATIVVALAALRALRMRARETTPSVSSLVQNVIVAFVYDVARALALIVRATHRTRREAGGEVVVA